MAVVRSNILNEYEKDMGTVIVKLVSIFHSQENKSFSCQYNGWKNGSPKRYSSKHQYSAETPHSKHEAPEISALFGVLSTFEWISKSPTFKGVLYQEKFLS